MEIRKIAIDRTVQNSPLVRSVISRTKHPLFFVDDVSELYREINASSDPVSLGKKTLFLTKNRGSFLKSCPGTRNYICCGYQILHIGAFCTMDCSYCILQSYFHPPILQLFINQDDLIAELDAAFRTQKTMRFGTGEFTDSLIWEFWTDLSKLLVTRFSRQNHSVLELKTKTTAINKLEGLQHNRKTIIAWSLNSEKVIREQEKNTASLSARLRAAEKCQSWGYPVAFHFDPMVIYPECEKDYINVLEKIFSIIRPENIVWISIGAFRFMPTLKPIIQRRFPDSKIVYGEFIKGDDGKMRYFKPIRIDLYKKMIDWLQKNAPGVLAYYCMEDEAVWKKTMGFSPEEKGGLPAMLDRSAERVCRLNDRGRINSINT